MDDFEFLEPSTSNRHSTTTTMEWIDPKTKLKEIFSTKYSILFRRDQVFVHPSSSSSSANTSKYPSSIPGVIFLLESHGIYYFSWIPYLLLLKLNERLVVHVKSNGEVVTKNYFKNSIPTPTSPLVIHNSEYMSATIGPSTTTTTTTTTSTNSYASSSYTILLPLQQLYSIKKVIPSMGYSFIIIVDANGISHSPLYFHDGHVQELFNKLQYYCTCKKSPHDSNLYLLSVTDTPHHSDELNKSMEQFSFDSYLDDVLKNTQGKPSQDSSNNNNTFTNALLEWGSKIHKTAKHMFSPPPPPSTHHSPSPSSFEHVMMESQELPSMMPLVTKIDTLIKSNYFVSTFDIQHYLDSETGKLIHIPQFKQDVYFYPYMEDGIRNMAWKFLLGYYPYSSTYEERQVIEVTYQQEYQVMKQQWKSLLPKQLERMALFNDTKHRIEKDVTRTDRNVFVEDSCVELQILHDILLTYSYCYNYDLQYCQGMNDYASICIQVCQSNEVEAFWMFVAMMDQKHIASHFQMNSSSIAAQLKHLASLIQVLDFEFYTYLQQKEALNLFFCFRWLLVKCKREFELEQCKVLWDKLFSEYYGEYFVLFVVCAMVMEKRQEIMEKEYAFDEILRVTVELSGKLDLNRIVGRAEELYKKYGLEMEKRKCMEETILL